MLETSQPLATFERLESEVRGYVRSFPTVFTKAKGSEMWDEGGRRYIDFFAGAGVLNFGHNPPALKGTLLEYLTHDGVVHGLDMATAPKRTFLERFEEVILKPRSMNYKVQFCGPTGTNSVEAALKLARKVTGRQNVVFFSNAFHGMTLGSLAATGNSRKRCGAAVPLCHTSTMPFDGYFGPDFNTLEFLERFLTDSSSGLDKPAAVILESIQAEGGVNVASFEWLKGLRELCTRHGILLILDEIQVGLGRTGPYFSFTPAGIEPDLITLSKSLTGYGMPMAILLMRPDLDQWTPGEHNGTFRGFNPGFVTATKALEEFWKGDGLTPETERKGAKVAKHLEQLAEEHNWVKGAVRGRGLIQGLVMEPGVAEALSAAAFEEGLVIETSGPKSEVLKVLPALTIPDELLDEGLALLTRALEKVAAART